MIDIISEIRFEKSNAMDSSSVVTSFILLIFQSYRAKVTGNFECCQFELVENGLFVFPNGLRLAQPDNNLMTLPNSSYLI